MKDKHNYLIFIIEFSVYIIDSKCNIKFFNKTSYDKFNDLI